MKLSKQPLRRSSTGRHKVDTKREDNTRTVLMGKIKKKGFFIRQFILMENQEYIYSM
jgi:hypothetical protein